MVKYQDKNLLIKKSVVEDCHFLSKNLRDEDRIELANCGQCDIFKTIIDSFALSDTECYSVFYHGKMAMMFGIKKEENIGRIWMLATDDVREFPLTFFKLAKKFIREFKSDNEYLYNFICESNLQSMKLLKYCGASFSDGYVSKKTKKPFLMFKINGGEDV